MSELSNPYAAHQNLSGRWGRVFEKQAGVEGEASWLANVTGVSYNVEVEHETVKRAGQMGQDEKEIGWSGSGSLSMDHVHSVMQNRIISWINQAGSTARYPEYILTVSLEDRGIIGLVIDRNGNATDGHEAITLTKVKFFDLPGGYEDGMITREYSFTFGGISLDHAIADSAKLDIEVG